MPRCARLVVCATTLALFPLAVVGTAATVGASGGDHAPDQSSCDPGGSTDMTWDRVGITNRPRFSSMSIDGESIDISRIEHPLVGEIGAAICPQDSNHAKNTGLYFYRRASSIETVNDLTGAKTPGGLTLSSTSQISFVIDDFGDNAPYFNFATVLGKVGSWTTSGAGTSSARLAATLTPTNNVFVDGRNDDSSENPLELGCTQQPPNCNATKSDLDVFSLSMQFKFERENSDFASFAGGYFALQSAIGGYIQSRDGTLVVSIGAPHFKADGTTPNVGSMTAFLPDAYLQQWFGINGASVTDSTFSVTRIEGGVTSSVPWAWAHATGGITVSVTDITFSSPVYEISKGGPSREQFIAFLTKLQFLNTLRFLNTLKFLQVLKRTKPKAYKTALRALQGVGRG